MRVVLRAFDFVREAHRLYAVGFFRTESAALVYAGTEEEARRAFERAGTGHSFDERMPDGSARFSLEPDMSVVLVARGGGRWTVQVGGGRVGDAEGVLPMRGPRWGGPVQEILHGAGVKLIAEPD